MTWNCTAPPSAGATSGATQRNVEDHRSPNCTAWPPKAGKPPLLPPDIDLLQGTLTVKDKHGNVVGTYRIEGGNLELALDTMQLTPV